MATKKGQFRKTSRRAYTGLARRRTGSRRFRNSPKLRKTEASLTRVRAQLRKARSASKGAQGPLMEAAAVTGGGAVAGVAEAYLPDGSIRPGEVARRWVDPRRHGRLPEHYESKAVCQGVDLCRFREVGRMGGGADSRHDRG